jgi:hypothetical protein
MGDSAGAPVLAAAADQAGPGPEEPFLDWAWTEAIEATELLRSVLAALGLHDGFPRLRGDVNVYGAPMVTVGRITPAAARRLAAALGRVVAGGVVAGGVVAACGVADVGAAAGSAGVENLGSVMAESYVMEACAAETFREGGHPTQGVAAGAAELGGPLARFAAAGSNAGAAGRLDGLGALSALSALSGTESFGGEPGMVPGQGNYAMRLPA